jgi:hypothetical protein
MNEVELWFKGRGQIDLAERGLELGKDRPWKAVEKCLRSGLDSKFLGERCR